MKTIVMGKQKGGIGATTLVRELAVAAAADGLRVVVMDLDPQHTLSKWWNRRTAGAEGAPNPALAAPAPEHVVDTIRQLGEIADLVIVDTPPSVHPFVGGVVALADLVLVPTRPTTDDVEALPPVLAQIDAAGRQFAFVLSQAAPGRSRLADDTLALLARRGRVAPIVRMRSDFPTAGGGGGTAFEAGGKSSAEIRELWAWAKEALDLVR